MGSNQDNRFRKEVLSLGYHEKDLLAKEVVLIGNSKDQ